jgi:hypothetical protein
MQIDLMSLIRTNYRARQILSEMSILDISKKYGVDFAQARKLKNYCALLEAAE